MLKIGTVLFLAAFVAAAAPIQKAPTSPTQPIGAQPHNQAATISSNHESKPNIDKRGTPAQPLIVSIPRTEEEEEEHRAQANENDARAVRESINIGLTVVLMVATVGMAFFTYKLFRATQQAVNDANSGVKVATESLNHARDTAHRELRAYIFPEAINPTPILHVNPMGVPIAVIGYTVEIIWRNCGKTPAIDLKTFIDKVVLATIENREPTFVANFGSEMDVGPNMPSRSAIQVPIEELMGIWMWEKEVFIYGRVEYKDIFSDLIRHFELCARIDLQMDPSQIIAGQLPSIALGAYGPQNSSS